MKKLGPYIIALILIALVSYGGWHLKRWFNYTWGYQSDVTKTVCELVKPEALVDPTKCK